jgi:hypothetical protein
LVYTRAQAAEALGISVMTLDRRVVPLIETVVTEWGRRWIPVSELERFLVERTQEPPRRPVSRGRRGRRSTLPPGVVADIRAERLRGLSFGAIARKLNEAGVKTGQGGRKWWPSTVRVVANCEPVADEARD